MIRKIIFVLVVSISLLLSGCEGATSGSVRSSSQSCHTLGGFGDCEGRIGRLTGSTNIAVEDEGISPGDDVVVELMLTVVEGTLEVTLLGVDGGQSLMQVTPGNPANVNGVLGGDFDSFEIGFRALGDYVEGIEYSLRYYIQ
jgi:hypothetical protein